MQNILSTIALLLLGLGGYAQQVKFDEWKNLTTSGKLPAQCKIQHSNNNLDIVKFKDRYYLAFRTAPTHFASTKTVIYIVSSKDLETWDYETEIKPGCDIREPRFSVYHDTLNMYFFTGSKSMFKFDPRELMVMRCANSKGWNTPQSTNMDGFVPWRVRERGDTLYMSAYYGRSLYRNSHKSNLRLFYSTNALTWRPISAEPQVDILSAEEGEFIFDKSGNMFATVRLEGTGSLVCKSDKLSLNKWQTVRSKTKYDSALLFNHNDDTYLVARRNLDGPIDKAKNRTSETKGRMRNLIRYWWTGKVTALFKLNKTDLTLTPVTDFPSTGDTAYPGIVQLDNDNYLLMNYSSNIKGHKKNWFNGQMGKTYIYWTKVHFDK